VATSGPSIPRVSFVIANYNYGRYVAQAIDSLLAQTFTDLELIVIDDCSTDDSRDILQRYADEPRVRLLYHATNQRNIRSYNEGLALARGEFVGIVCADDFCLRPDAVERQVAIFDAHPNVGFVYSAQTYVDAQGVAFRLIQPWSADYVRDGLAEFSDLAFRNYVPNTGTLVRRIAHDQLGLYDPALPHAGDWDLWLRVATAYQVGYLAEPMYAYRMHGSNLSVAGHSPRQANREIALAVSKGFDALPANAPPALRALRRSAIQHVLLATCWGDRSLGRVRRAWIGLLDAAWRSPSLLGTRMFHAALGRTLLLTMLGYRRYQDLSRRRGASVRDGAPASVPAPQG
jgi:glycosyltransferase involved in cell wall biosynthesis